MDHGVECDLTKDAGAAIRYVRALPVVDGQQKELDLGKLQWAIADAPSDFDNQQGGELWRSYAVKQWQNTELPDSPREKLSSPSSSSSREK